MEDYIVSARKYRPVTFDSVVGQKALVATLKNAINSGKLANTYLFCGDAWREVIRMNVIHLYAADSAYDNVADGIGTDGTDEIMTKGTRVRWDVTIGDEP